MPRIQSNLQEIRIDRLSKGATHARETGSMRIIGSLVGVFACLVWDMAHNHGAWIRTTTLLVRHVLVSVGLA
jgi:hypothetical protein